MRFGGAAVFLAALSNITVSPIAPQEEVDTLPQETQKPLLTDDISGSPPTEHKHFTKNIFACISQWSDAW